MTTTVYDGAQTATSILIGYSRYLRDEMVNMTNDEINERIQKLQNCADNTHGPKRHEDLDQFIEICRTELDDRALVCALVREGLIDGGQPTEDDSDE